MEQKLDFIGIGDITSDAFIRLKNASVHCDINREHCEICMSFGAKLPYEAVTVVPAVGNSSNASVCAAKLGLKSALVSNLGDDEHGAEALAALEKSGVKTDFVKKHRDRATNYHYVLWFEDDRTILIKHEEYPYELPALPAARWAYLSSLGEQPANSSYYKAILTWLNSDSEIQLAFQPGTFQLRLGAEAMVPFYRRSKIFFCNTSESKMILKKPKRKWVDTKELLNGIHDLGPQIVVITDGPKGAYSFDGKQFLFMRPYPDPKPSLERTGAGDAFSATVISALALGKDLTEALRWGPINSMSIVQKIGAQAGLLAREELERYLAAAPADYQPRAI